MTPAIIESTEEVRASQQAMIQTLEQAGLKRQNIAAHMGVDVSYLGHIMSESSCFTAGARVDRALFRLCTMLDQDQHVETLLPSGKYVATDPEVKTNNCYLDEIRDSLEVTGEISRVERHQDHTRIRSYFRNLKAVAIRGEREAAAALRKLGSVPLGG